MVLWDLILHAKYFRAHFTDFGVLPTWSTPWLINYHPGHWSLHLASGNWQWQAILFALAGVAAIALRGGLPNPLGHSDHLGDACLNTNPASTLLNGGDHLLRMLMFWSIFLPLGSRWSLDNYRSGKEESPPLTFSSASIAIMLQMCLLYWVAGFTKTVPAWTETRSALYYALNIDHIASGFGKWLLNYPELLRWLTTSTLWLECWGPFLLFVPFFTARISNSCDPCIRRFSYWNFSLHGCRPLPLGLHRWLDCIPAGIHVGLAWQAIQIAGRENSTSGKSMTQKTPYAAVLNIAVAILLVYGAAFQCTSYAASRFQMVWPPLEITRLCIAFRTAMGSVRIACHERRVADCCRNIRGWEPS